MGQVESQGARRSSLSDDDVEPEVLQRGIEDLLDRPVEAMDLVDEQHIVSFETGEDRGHVALALERRSSHAADSHPKLLTDDVGEARLAEPWRSNEQHMVERFIPALCCVQRNRELFLDPLLPDELAQPTRPQRLLEVLFLGRHSRPQEWCGGGH